MEKNIRPISAYPQNNRKRLQGATSLKNDVILKDRVSPAKFSNYFSKEDLHEQVSLLKNRINELSEENKHLRARVIRLEKQKAKRMLSNYKTGHNFLNHELEKGRSSTKALDLQKDNQMLREELEKQKNIIEEFTQSPPPDFRKIYEKYAEQCLKVKKLKDEVAKLKQDQSGSRRKEFAATEFREEIQNQGRHSREKLCHAIVNKIFESSNANSLEFDELWFVINPNNLENINFQEFSRGMKGLGLDVSQEELENCFAAITVGSKATRSQFEKFLKKYKLQKTFSNSKHL